MIILMNEGSGEILDPSKYKIMKRKEFVEEAELIITLEDILSGKIDKEKLYGLMRREKEINEFNFMKVSGAYLNMEVLGLAFGTGVEKEFYNLLGLISTRNTIKKNREKNCNESCKNWTELFEALKVTDSVKKKKLKKFLLDNDLVSLSTIKFSKEKEVKNMYFNPNWVRHGSHASMMSISAFKSSTLSKIHKYNTYILFLNGFVNMSDLKKKTKN